MKYLDEYRNPQLVKKYVAEIKKVATRKWTIMEVCGGQTHSIIKYGIDQMVAEQVELIHGPGCPVCVTPIHIIDTAIQISLLSDVIFCTFGDMIRVPGSKNNLMMAKANGADVRIVYSPLDALEIARQNKHKKVVFFAIGFETTAPGNAMVIFQAKQENIHNFSVLVSHVLVPPALDVLFSSPHIKVHALLAAGHVCTIMGYEKYEDIAQKKSIPIVVTGFEPADILQGLYMCILQLEKQEAKIENAYTRIVHVKGNEHAQKMIENVFKKCDQNWRGIGVIPESGLCLNDNYKEFDAAKKFPVDIQQIPENNICISGLILQGIKKPIDCPAFKKQCTPENPLGATMVSSEGACAAYYQYQRGSCI